jgi:hypothetical protein
MKGYRFSAQRIRRWAGWSLIRTPSGTAIAACQSSVKERRNHQSSHKQREEPAMKDPRNMRRIETIKRRAAEIRHGWSPAERQRRTGLPPDTPWILLRDFFASYPAVPAAAVAAQERNCKQWRAARGMVR